MNHSVWMRHGTAGALIDRSSIVARSGVRISWPLGQRATASVRFVQRESTASTAYQPALDDFIQIREGSSILFLGRVVEIQDRPLQAPDTGTETTIQAVDHTEFLDQIRITREYSETSLTLKQIVIDLVTSFLIPYGISYDMTPSGPTLTPPPVFNDVTAREVFNDLAAATGYLWRMHTINETTAEVVVFAPGDKTADFAELRASLGDGQGGVSWTLSRGKYANRIRLSYGSLTRKEIVQSWTGNGVLTTFDLDYPLAQTFGYVYYPGSNTYESIGAVGAGGVWETNYIDVGTGSAPGATAGTIHRTSGAVANGTVFQLTYAAQFPAVIIAEDSGEIFTHGVWEELFEYPEIYDRDTADAIASNLLTQFATTPRIVTVTTRQSLALVGDAVTLEFPTRDISAADYLISNIEATLAIDGVLEYQLTCAESVISGQGWLNYFGSGGGRGSSTTTVSGITTPQTSGFFEAGISAPAGVYERSRSVRMGEWAAFTPSGGVSNGTGTISAITVVANGCRYMRVGTTLTFTLQFTFTMAGAGGGDTQLTFDLPGGLTATAQQVAAARVFDTGAVYDGLGIIFTSSNTKFFVNKIPTAAFGNGAGNAIQGTVVIETTT